MFRLIWIAAFLLSGCEVINEHHGYVPCQKTFAQVQQGIGRLTQEDVVQLLGSPSCVLPYDPMTWYYVSYGLAREAFFYPKTTENTTVTIEFSKNGLLSNVKQSSGFNNIVLVGNSTPLPTSHGEEFLKQIFRNVGRFPPIARPMGP